MSGGKESQDESLSRGHTDYVRSCVANDSAANDAMMGPVRNVRKLEIAVNDEVFYPTISFGGTNIFNREEVLRSEHSEPVKTGSTTSEVESMALQMESEPIQIMTDAVKKTDEPKQRKSKWKILRSLISTTVVGVVAVMALVLVGLRLAGFRTLTVMSGSMEPSLPVGALVYVKPVDYHTLEKGDIISFVANDDKVVVTHRIDEILVDEEDTSVWRFRTKGDANEAADANLVHYRNVLGTPIVILPNIGYFAHNIQQPPGIYIALVVGTLLLAWTFLPGTLEERRKTARKNVAKVG